MAIKQALDDANDPAKVGTQFTVRNPHPGFVDGDPNIKNEYGHTNYPKWVDHPTEKEEIITTTYEGKNAIKNVIKSDFPKKVLVQNEDEEKALMAGEKVNSKGSSKGWDKTK